MGFLLFIGLYGVNQLSFLISFNFNIINNFNKTLIKSLIEFIYEY